MNKFRLIHLPHRLVPTPQSPLNRILADPCSKEFDDCRNWEALAVFPQFRHVWWNLRATQLDSERAP